MRSIIILCFLLLCSPLAKGQYRQLARVDFAQLVAQIQSDSTAKTEKDSVKMAQRIAQADSLKNLQINPLDSLEEKFTFLKNDTLQSAMAPLPDLELDVDTPNANDVLPTEDIAIAKEVMQTDSASLAAKVKGVASQELNKAIGTDINLQDYKMDSATVANEAKAVANDQINSALGTNVDMSMLKMDSTTGKKVEEAVVARAKEELKENSTMKGITKELGEGEQFNMGEDIMDGDFETNPKAMQEQLKEKVKEKAVDHFEGKDEQVQSAIQTVSTLKSRYSKLNSLKDATKKRPNTMGDKPFVQRLKPGIYFQFFTKEHLLMDIYPTLGYRFNDQLTAGMGYVYRWDTKYGAHSDKVVYGPRVFGEYELTAGFYPRLEVEMMRTDFPPINKSLNELDQRIWIYAVNIGLKKEFKLYHKLKGSTMIMINVLDALGISNKSVYPNIINTRIGFEFDLMK